MAIFNLRCPIRRSVLLRDRSKQTLASQLVIFVLISMAIVFIGVGLVVQTRFRANLKNTQLENLKHLAHEKIYLLDGIIGNAEEHAWHVKNLILDYGFKGALLDKLICDVRDSDEHIHSVCFIKDVINGVPRLYYNEGSENIIKDIETDYYLYEDWYLIPTITQKSHWSEPWVDNEGSKDLIVSYSVPFEDVSGRRYLMRMDVELSRLQIITNELECSDHGHGFLVSSTGTLVSFRDMDLVMNESIFSMAQEYNDPCLRQMGRKMIAGENGHINIKGKSPFRKNWIYFQPLQTNNWSVGVMMSEAELYLPIRVILIIYYVATILIFILITISIYYRLGVVLRPLKDFSKVAEEIGYGSLDIEIPQSNTSLELSTLAQSFRLMQVSLKEYITDLIIATKEKDRIRNDVIYASEIQNKLIPQNTENPFGIKELRIHGILQPAGDIGGDLYDYFMIDEHHLSFVIADVLGKGIVAAMAMTMASTLLPSIAPYYHSSSEMLGQLNNFLCKNNLESNFITILLGIVDLRDGKLQFSNCGHLPLFIRRLDGSVIKYKETHATALGVFENIKIKSEDVQLEMGDEIILVTDGITESTNADGEYLGINGLEEILRKLPHSNPENTAKNLLAKVNEYSESTSTRDDITILVMDYRRPKSVWS